MLDDFGSPSFSAGKKQAGAEKHPRPVLVLMSLLGLLQSCSKPSDTWLFVLNMLFISVYQCDPVLSHLDTKQHPSKLIQIQSKAIIFVEAFELILGPTHSVSEQ